MNMEEMGPHGNTAMPVKEGGFRTLYQAPPIFASGTSVKAQATSFEAVAGKTSNFSGYGTGILGPTIMIERGQDFSLRLENGLGQATNIHWHGLIVPAEMDGGPSQVVSAGSSFQYNFPIVQRAGTYWYHPHPHGNTARQVHNGLGGAFIVTDTEERSLNLPSGEQDKLLVLQDKRIGDSGNVVYSPFMSEIMTGYFGNHILVNGIYSPVIEVKSRFHRLRMVNGSTARVYNLALSTGKSFHVIGGDGGLLPAPEQLTSVFLAPGERVDILVDFSTSKRGDELYLISDRFEGGVQGNEAFEIAKFRVTEEETENFTIPAFLSHFEPIDPSAVVNSRTFTLFRSNKSAAPHRPGGGMGMHTINNLVFDQTRIDARVKADTVEEWIFDNSQGDEIHPMHIHALQFRVVERTGGRNRLTATEKGWKDTVLVMPGEKVKLLVPFPSYRGKYVFHCHNLEHEDDGMMLNFLIE
jgi:blue copper oxidase